MSFETQKAIIEKSLDEVIQKKWVTVHELIAIGGIAAHIANDLETAKREEKEQHDRGQLYELLEKYFPGKLEKIFSEDK